MFMPQQPKLTPEQKAFLRQRTKATVSNFLVVVLALRAATKDYIPGPGEYDIPSEDIGKHRRFGFLTQNRFGTDGSDGYTGNDFYYASGGDTSYGTSIANNIKTDDARTRKQIMDMVNQFERQRNVMQKEIETLQSKGRKLDANLQAVSMEKNSLQAQLQAKELELADVRQKNSGLQKTVARHDKTIEKSQKFMQLSKKVEEMEKELESAKADTLLAQEQISRDSKNHETVVAEKGRAIAQLRAQLNEQTTKANNLSSQLESSQEQAKRAEEESKEALNTAQLELQTTRAELSVTQTELREKTEAGELMEKQIKELESEVSRLHMVESKLSEEIQQMKAKHCEEIQQTKAKHCEEIQQTKAKHCEEMETCEMERTKMEEDMAQLNQQLQQCLQDIESLSTRVSATQHESAQHLHTIHQKEIYLERNQKVSCRIQAQFETYRSYINHVIQELRDQSRKQCRQRDAELGKVFSELHEAKKFINQQAQNIEGLKSELHWMGKWNKYLWELAQSIHQDASDHWSFFHPSESEHDTRFKSCTTQTSLMSNLPSRLINVGGRPFSNPTGTLKMTNDWFSKKFTYNCAKDIPKNDSGFGLSCESKRL
ncbi:hypothetical protein EC973_007078 [Apophysomyces ossiformis]|uniref:Uncharacterized protein n=1 Tax=Apophysomyces ossiformis TaxID=679940 RepID=A0A8H7EU08_9FUNG|nr:hypothetical protein EC973_007078 [Apophysomyces ossiformis]